MLTELRKGASDLQLLFNTLHKMFFFKKVCTLKRSVDVHTMVSIVAVFYADLGPYLIFSWPFMVRRHNPILDSDIWTSRPGFGPGAVSISMPV